MHMAKTRFDSSKPMQVGGQAVIEGVMMRAPRFVATAVRRTNGSITVRRDKYTPLSDKSPIFKLPVLRGAAALIEMLVIGLRTLNWSAEIALLDAEAGDGQGNGHPRRTERPKRDAVENVKLGAILALSLALGIAIFFVTPLVVATLLFRVEQDPFWFNIVAGGIRVVLLLAYLGAISLMKDVRRLFAYHGAEHKAVFAFEMGALLEAAAASRQSRFHPRCGTSFLLVVMLVAIVLFGVLDTIVIGVLGHITIGIRLLTHLPLLPLVGGVSYEFIKVSARNATAGFGRWVVAPGLWLQGITTQEPNAEQIEVALVALRAALGEETVLPPLPESVITIPISVN
jgi:uncharacterized protein YqhQ